MLTIVNRRTDTVQRIEAVLGDRYVGVYDGIEKDSTFVSVRAATRAATEAGADLLIAVGGGSVMVATRVVAIFMAGARRPIPDHDAVSRGQTGLQPAAARAESTDHQYSDYPDQRHAPIRRGPEESRSRPPHGVFRSQDTPQDIFLDEAALLSAPPELLRSTATTVFASNVVAMSQIDINPLAEASRNHAFRLAFRAYPRLVDEVDNPAMRIDFAVAALLQDRAEDDGARRYRGGAFAGNYAISTALHVRYPHVGQGEATSVVHATKIRLSDKIDARAARQVAEALEVWRDGMDARQAALAVADNLENLYSHVGVPTRLRQIEIPRDDLQAIANETVKNFNFNPGQRSAEDQIADALRLLEAAF